MIHPPNINLEINHRANNTITVISDVITPILPILSVNSYNFYCNGVFTYYYYPRELSIFPTALLLPTDITNHVH